MSMDDIRKVYGVPAKRGMRVRCSPPGFEPREGTIVGSLGLDLRIRMDPLHGMVSKPWTTHPMQNVEYLTEEGR